MCESSTCITKTDDCTILDRSVLNNFILADELTAKASQSLSTYVSVNSSYAGNWSHYLSYISQLMKDLKLL